MVKKTTLVNQPSSNPTRKIAAVGVGGVALAPLIIWLIELAGLNIPAEAAAVIAGLVSTLAGYMTKSSSREL